MQTIKWKVEGVQDKEHKDTSGGVGWGPWEAWVGCRQVGGGLLQCELREAGERRHGVHMCKCREA